MPRDLFSRQSADEATPLTASPDAQTPRGGSFAEQMRISKGHDEANLHPYIQTLGIADLDSCVALENATFPEQERCSKEKFVYRLTTCPELAIGLFSTSDPSGKAASAPTFASARSPDSQNPNNKGVLVGHVIATQCAAPRVTDESMDYPPKYRQHGVSRTEIRGHREGGRTIAVHSLAVLPQFQGQGLGKTVLKAYVQRMETSGIGDRVALLAHDGLISFYENVGFRNLGGSEVKFGGGGWNDMVYEFSRQ